MSPDHENLNRQLETLQRYVARLQRERTAMAADRTAAPGARRPPGRWLLATALLVVLALVGGVAVGATAWSDDRQASSTTLGDRADTTAAEPGAGAGAPVATPECKAAADRANTMLAVAVGLQRELATYRKVMLDPEARDRPGRDLVAQTAPALRAGSAQSASLDRALADYRQVVDGCRLRSP